jgi:spore maturation protein CgeB
MGGVSANAVLGGIRRAEQSMHFVIFGLTLSSSWGNGHATLWRGLLKALANRGHSAVFYEKDVSYYRDARDGWLPPAGVRLRLYADFAEIVYEVARELPEAEVAMVTSYCPDGVAASRLLLDSPARLKVFYDLDTPVTLDALRSGTPVTYLPEAGLAGFDLVLSYTGGRALEELQTHLGAQRVAPLYGWVDPEIHRAADPLDEFHSSLSYLGTYAADRQPALMELFVKPAHARPEDRFVIGGAQYPQDFPWAENIYFVRHLPPWLHPAFFCSGRATLNVTRRAMADYGFCPSGRLFEAAACGTPIITDIWDGLDSFFAPGDEILPVRSTADVLGALSLSDAELRRIGEAARERTLTEHTAACRAGQLERILESTYGGQLQSALTAQ